MADSRAPLYMCVGLACLVLVIYARTLGHDFVTYDDPDYAFENPHLKGGLTLENAEWAFTHTHSANWHPLTWLSHMLDWDLYGDRAGGHHLTSALIHAANSALLFLALRSLSGSLWPAAAAAALWAAHPLRVESVAWVSERKDVLSGLFFMLTLLAYAGYARAPSVGRYALVAVLLALGLMAKPMLVTLPALLLLLDWWPLGRLVGREGLRRCVVEKLPLLILSAASCAVTIHAQRTMHAFIPLEHSPPEVRLANAINSYCTYVVQMVLPVDLAVFYPHPGRSMPAWHVALALTFLAGATAGAVLLRKGRPYVLVGWLWYLGMLVPVIGFVQVGLQAHADRYTYLPQVGLCVAAAWALADLPRRTHLAVGAVAILGALSVQQAGYWRDSATLFGHALDCTTDNAFVHTAYGNVMLRQRKPDEAERHFRRAIAISDDVEARSSLGRLLLERGRVEEAAEQFAYLHDRYPQDPLARSNLALVHVSRGFHAEQGRLPAQAATEYEAALAIYPDLSDGPAIRKRLVALYMALAEEAQKGGRHADALAFVRKAAGYNPDNPAVRAKLGELQRNSAP